MSFSDAYMVNYDVHCIHVLNNFDKTLTTIKT